MERYLNLKAAVNNTLISRHAAAAVYQNTLPQRMARDMDIPGLV